MRDEELEQLDVGVFGEYMWQEHEGCCFRRVMWLKLNEMLN